MLADYALTLLRRLPPEAAHRATVAGSGAGLRPAQPLRPTRRASRRGCGAGRFPIRSGLAAGFDKNAEVPDAMLALGFGFVEIGTVTPRPQPGNPKPRLFRLEEDHAVINRLGFNSEGLAAVQRRLAKRRSRRGSAIGIGPVGANIGRNRETGDEIEDYVLGVRALAPLVDYLVVNVSSPNTPGLRELQRKNAVERLMERILPARAEACRHDPPPLLLKIAPDLTREERADLAQAALASPYRRTDHLPIPQWRGRTRCAAIMRMSRAG